MEHDPIEVALHAVGGRLRPLIVWQLSRGPRPFRELERGLSGIGPRTLRRVLVQMEEGGIIRIETPGTPVGEPVFALTSRGETLRPVVAAMYDWGRWFRAASQ